MGRPVRFDSPSGEPVPSSRDGQGVGRSLLAAATLAWAALLPGSAAGQWTDWLGDSQAELRTGLSVGSHSESGAALDIVPKISVDVVFKRQVHPSWSAFGGYYRTTFGCEEGFCTGLDLSIVGNHGVLGAEWTPHMPWLRGQPWARAGLLFGSTEAGMDGDSPQFGPGIGLGAGAVVSFGRLLLLPGVSYRWLSANTTSDSAHAVALSMQLGFGIRLSGG